MFARIHSLAEEHILRRNMIDRLMKEAAEEADGKSFCDTEIAKSRTKQKELSSKVSVLSS